ncbi:MAG: aspartyl protease family protein [Bacteroidota bacterium]
MKYFHTHISILIVCIGLVSCAERPHRSDPDQLQFVVWDDIIILDMYINNRKAKFIVDTGASISLIDTNQSAKYRYQYYANDNKGQLTGFGGQENFVRTSVIELSSCEGVHYNNVKFYAANLNHINKVLSSRNIQVLGILGADFLNGHKVVINYHTRRLVITR